MTGYELTDDYENRWQWSSDRPGWIQQNGRDTINLWDHATGKPEPMTLEAFNRQILEWIAEEQGELTEIWAEWNDSGIDAGNPGQWVTIERAEELAAEWMEDARDSGESVKIWMREHSPECYAEANNEFTQDPEPCHCPQYEQDHNPNYQYPPAN